MSTSVLGYLILLPIVVILMLLLVLLCLLYVLGVSLFVTLALSEYLCLPAPLRLANVVAAAILSPFACLVVISIGTVISFSSAASALTLVPLAMSTTTSSFFMLLHRMQLINPRIPIEF